MAYSAVGYTGDGVTRTFSIPFDYILKTEIIVYKNDTILRMGLDYTLNAGVLTMSSIPAAGAVVKIYRRTDLSKRKVEWKAAGSFTAADHNLNTKQLFYLCQELYDMVNGAITGDITIPPVIIQNETKTLLENLSFFLINHTTVEFP